MENTGSAAIAGNTVFQSLLLPAVVGRFPVFQSGQSRHVANGSSLVEILIGLFLGLLLCLLLVSSWLVNYRAFSQTTQLAELQQNGQFMLSFMQQELANQQFWAGLDAGSLRAPELTAPVADCAGSVDSGSFGRDDQPFFTLYSGTVGANSMPGCLNNAQQGSDFIQLKRLAGSLTPVGELKFNRVYLQLSPASAEFVTSQSSGLSADFRYFPYVHQLFYVAVQQQQGREMPVLMRKRLIRQQQGQLVIDTSSVLDGVEHLHFEFGIDTNADGQADYSTTAMQIPAEIWSGQQAMIMQVRFYLLLRSLTADPSYSNHQQYQLGQRLFQAPGDPYRRLLVSSAVTFNNLKPKEL